MHASSQFRSELSSKDIIISVVFHALLITAGIVMSYDTYQQKKEKLLLIKKKNRIVESAVRVDVVSMPKLTVKELKEIKRVAPAEEVKPVKVEAKVEKASAKQEEAASADFQNLLKTLSQEKIDLKKVKKKQKEKAQVKAKSKEEIAREKQRRDELKKLVLEGNKISQGNQVFSDKTTTKKQKQNLEIYAQNMTTLIQPYWSLPNHLLNKDLSCQIRVYISENGDLLKTVIYKKSGNNEFDQRAVLAVERAAPFGIPPREVRSSLVNGEILLGFPL